VGGANAPKVVPPGSPYTIEYAGTDTAAIRVGTTANQGNIGTLDTTFSHYRLSWESKYDAINANSNSGLTYHVDESAIRMNNNWPRSIEFQGKQSEVGSAFSIQQVTFTTRTSSSGQGANYVSTGGGIVQACEFGCNGRWYKGNPLITPYASATPTVPRWLRFHLVARGADSAIHIVNDTTVMRLWNIRIFNDSTKPTGSTSSNSSAASNNTPARPWDRGGLGWQAEGATVRYRQLEIMRIPPTTPMNAHYLHRVLLDTPSTFVMVGTTTNIKWRSIGSIPKVKIEYRYTSPVNGNWVTIADSAANTGSYAWNVPMEAQGLAKGSSTVYGAIMRISSSSQDYVLADTNQFSVAFEGTSINPNILKGSLSFGLPGRVGILTGLSAGTQVEVRDVSGSLIRTLSLGDKSLTWDRRNVRGAKVPTGLYFVRALNEGVQYRTGRVVVD
jgi:hypothetical protein